MSFNSNSYLAALMRPAPSTANSNAPAPRKLTTLSRPKSPEPAPVMPSVILATSADVDTFLEEVLGTVGHDPAQETTSEVAHLPKTTSEVAHLPKTTSEVAPLPEIAPAHLLSKEDAAFDAMMSNGDPMESGDDSVESDDDSMESGDGDGARMLAAQSVRINDPKEAAERHRAAFKERQNGSGSNELRNRRQAQALAYKRRQADLKEKRLADKPRRRRTAKPRRLYQTALNEARRLMGDKHLLVETVAREILARVARLIGFYPHGFSGRSLRLMLEYVNRQVLEVVASAMSVMHGANRRTLLLSDFGWVTNMMPFLRGLGLMSDRSRIMDCLKGEPVLFPHPKIDGDVLFADAVLYQTARIRGAVKAMGTTLKDPEKGTVNSNVSHPKMEAGVAEFVNRLATICLVSLGFKVMHVVDHGPRTTVMEGDVCYVLGDRIMEGPDASASPKRRKRATGPERSDDSDGSDDEFVEPEEEGSDSDSGSEDDGDSAAERADTGAQ